MSQKSFCLWVESRVFARGIGDAVAKDPMLRVMGVTFNVKAIDDDIFEIFITIPSGRKVKVTMDRRNQRTVNIGTQEVRVNDVPAAVKESVPKYVEFVKELQKLQADGLIEAEMATRLDDNSNTMFAVFKPKNFNDYVGVEIKNMLVQSVKIGVKGEGDVQKSIGKKGSMAGDAIRFPSNDLRELVRFLIKDSDYSQEHGMRPSDDAVKARFKEVLRADGWTKVAASQIVRPTDAQYGSFEFMCTLERTVNGMNIKYSGHVEMLNNSRLVYTSNAMYDVQWGDMSLKNIVPGKSKIVESLPVCENFAKSVAELHRKVNARIKRGFMFYSYGFGEERMVSKNPIYNEKMGNSNRIGLADSEKEFVEMLGTPQGEESFTAIMMRNSWGGVILSEDVDSLISRFVDGEEIINIARITGVEVRRDIDSLAGAIFGGSTAGLLEGSTTSLLEGSTDQRISAIKNKIDETSDIDLVGPMMSVAKKHFEEIFPQGLTSNVTKRTEMINAIAKWVVNVVIRKTNMSFMAKTRNMSEDQKSIIVKAARHAVAVACKQIPDVLSITGPSYYNGRPEENVEIAMRLMKVIRQNNTGLRDIEKIADDYHALLRQINMKSSPTEGTEVIKEFENGLKWRLYAKGGCPEEGRASGHCGNGEGRPGDRLLSLRTKNEKALATFVYNNGELVEMKAAYNEKPSKNLHPAIMWLITNKKPMGGKLVPEIKPIHSLNSSRFLQEKDFHPDDLSKNDLARLKAERPDLFWKGRN